MMLEKKSNSIVSLLAVITLCIIFQSLNMILNKYLSSSGMNFEVLLFVKEMGCYRCNIKIFSWYCQSKYITMEGSATFLRSSMPSYGGVISFEPKSLLTSLTNYQSGLYQITREMMSLKRSYFL